MSKKSVLIILIASCVAFLGLAITFFFMDLSDRKTLVKVLADNGELDQHYNPILSVIGSFFARVVYPSPKDAISTGTLAVVKYAQIFFLWTDYQRIGILPKHKLQIGNEIFEINGTPTQIYEKNKLYLGLNVSKKLENA